MKTTAITTINRRDRFHYAENTPEYNQYFGTGISMATVLPMYRAKEHLPEKLHCLHAN